MARATVCRLETLDAIGVNFQPPLLTTSWNGLNAELKVIC